MKLSFIVLILPLLASAGRKYPFLITKDSFANHRNEKSGLPALPKPFVVTTSLHVKHEEEVNGRRGRQYKDKDGSIVVEGIRMPDDESDRITWRNGRVINNVFVPNEEIVAEHEPKQLARNGKSADLHQGDLAYRAGNTDSGRPVYYVVDNDGSSSADLHSDRSPYHYEPADGLTSIDTLIDNSNRRRKPSKQSSSDFVIQEHTYSMCEGCPTFSIPVPVPKSSVKGYREKASHEAGGPVRSSSAFESSGSETKEENFLEKIGNSFLGTMKKLQDQALSVFQLSPDSEASSAEQQTALREKADHLVAQASTDQEVSSGLPQMSPAVFAGVAAMAVGGMALLSSASTLNRIGGNGRSIDEARKDFFAERLYRAIKAMEDEEH